MGADYDAKTFLGVPVTEADLIRKAKMEVVRCSHEEARGQRFCPRCGLAEEKRTEWEVQSTIAPLIATCLPAPWKYQHSVAGLLSYTSPDYGGATLLGFRFLRLDPSSEDSNGQLIYGMRLATAESQPWRDQRNPEVNSFALTVKVGAQIEEGARILGFSEAVKLYTLCYVGV